MITFEVLHNGNKVCSAGAPNLGVLSSIVTWVSRKDEDPPRDEQLDLTIGGLVSFGPEKGTHHDWARLDLQCGDEIVVRIKESECVDSPLETRPPEENEAMMRAHEQTYVRKMCEKFGWTINEERPE